MGLQSYLGHSAVRKWQNKFGKISKNCNPSALLNFPSLDTDKHER